MDRGLELLYNILNIMKYHDIIVDIHMMAIYIYIHTLHNTTIIVLGMSTVSPVPQTC